jgi:hypothetical protein
MIRLTFRLYGGQMIISRYLAIHGANHRNPRSSRVDNTGFEPVTPAVSRRCSPAELNVHVGGSFHCC